MSAILKEVHDAFLDAGATEEKATEAAKAMASYDRSNDSRFGEMNQQFSKLHIRMSKFESDMRVLKWMVGLIIVVNVLPMLKALFL